MIKKQPMNIIVKNFLLRKMGISEIATLGMLLVIYILLRAFLIPIPGMQIGFENIPLIIVGWFFGPLIGIVFAPIADLIACLITGNVYVFFYAIQPPIICLIAALFSFLYQTIKLQNKWLLLILFEIINVSFVITGMIFIFVFSNADFNQAFSNKNGLLLNEATIQVLRYGASAVLLIYFSLMQFIYFFKWRKEEWKNLLIFSSLTIIVSNIITSWIIGPYAFEFWLKSIGSAPIQYNFLLISRIIKESFRIPLDIIITFSLLKVMNLYMEKNTMRNTQVWKK